MKIITEGRKILYWPWSEEWRCDDCDCVFQPEEGQDAIEEERTGYGEGDSTWKASCPCPSCGSRVTIYN